MTTSTTGAMLLLAVGLGCEEPEPQAPGPCEYDLDLLVDPDLAAYLPGAEVAVSASSEAAGTDIQYLSWSLDGQRLGEGPGPHAFVLQETTVLRVAFHPDCEMTRTFAVQALTGERTLTMRVDDGGGDVTMPDGSACQDACTAVLPAGSTATVTAHPRAGYQFVGWSGCSTETTPTLAVTLNEDQDCTARFAASDPGCDDPLTVALRVLSPSLQCSTTYAVDETTYPAVEVARPSATVAVSTSHPIGSLGWDTAVQDAAAPSYQESPATFQDVLLDWQAPHGVAVEVTDRCVPARTTSTLLVIIYDDAMCE